MSSPKKRVYFRVFPTETINFKYMKLDQENNAIYVRHLQEINTDTREKNYWQFPTDGLFFNAKQEQVYQRVMEGVLEDVLNGQNAVVFAFGQSGCGKTFSTSGLYLSEEEFGILPRTVADLFALKRKEPPNMKVTIQMSYVEFYNTHALDLLGDSRNVPKDIAKCRDVRRVALKEELDALRCIFMAEGRKNFKEHCKYLSNIATSVATFIIIRKNMDLTDPTKTYSRLHIVDMAGNDSCQNIKQLCKTPHELGIANTTKSQLEHFALCLRENIPKNIRIRQRTNALMYYLAGDFSNQSLLRFIGHIKVDSSELNHLIITLSMLRFGNIVQGLKMKKKPIQFDVNEEVELEYLRNKLKSIEQEKYLNSVLLNRDLVTGLNPARVDHLNRLVNEFLINKTPDITVMNVADTRIVLDKVKRICQSYQDDLDKLKIENQTLLNLTQQRSDTSLRRGSKSSAQSLVSKISRKSSKTKSKESLSGGKEKPVNGSMGSEKRLRRSFPSEDITITERSTPRRKKSVKSNSSTLKQSAGIKFRKSSNTSIDKRESRGSLKSSEVGQLIPDIMPEKQDLLKQFTNSQDYKELIEEYKLNEKDVKSSFATYTKEIKKLNLCKDALDKCKNDLIMAHTYRKFNRRDELDEYGDLTLSYAETECRDRLEDAKYSLTDQQERTLIAQEEFKVYLENRHRIIKKAEEQFDQYCVDNYRVPSGEIDEIQRDLIPFTAVINLESTCDVEETEQGETLDRVPEPSVSTQLLRNLQRLMKSERRMLKRLKEKKKNEWKSVF